MPNFRFHSTGDGCQHCGTSALRLPNIVATQFSHSQYDEDFSFLSNAWHIGHEVTKTRERWPVRATVDEACNSYISLGTTGLTMINPLHPRNIYIKLPLMAQLSSLSNTSNSLPLLYGNITLGAALEDDENTLQRIAYPEQRTQFYVYLRTHRSQIESIVLYHLGCGGTATCRIADVEEWMAGSYNVCIPVYVNNWARHRVLIRFPLPYKIGEFQNPGNSDEKLRSEAATFIWIKTNCPRVPIPHLWGFGFSGGQSFTAPENVSFFARLKWNLQRSLLSWLRYPSPCQYVGRRGPCTLKVGYLVLEYVEGTTGKMLSETWERLRQDKDRRTNLFRDLSYIMLSLLQNPLPRIGSLTIDDQGVMSLTNRPLTLRLQDLENQGIPTDIERGLTYSTTEAYILDLLRTHDNRLRYQPNSIRDKGDARAQMAALTVMRAIYPYYLRRDLRHGPFVFSLRDLHPGNILIDRNGNIKCIIDLEWACSLPIEMLHPPSWLTSQGVDEIGIGEHLDAYASAHKEFMDIFEQQEKSFPTTKGDPSYYTCIMRRGWMTGNLWYFWSLENPRGLYMIFLQHIQPLFEVSDVTCEMFDQVVADYWSADAAEVIAVKIKDKEVYENQLQRAFEGVRNHVTNKCII